jgi:hypothetical protein
MVAFSSRYMKRQLLLCRLVATCLKMVQPDGLWDFILIDFKGFGA